MQPMWQWRRGERVRNPNGTLRPYHERASRWSRITKYYDRREDDLDPDETSNDLGPRLNDRLREFLVPFVREREFVRSLVGESSSSWVLLRFPGQFHFGFELEPSVVASIADLGLTFGFEIFPDSAT
ncbi:MAG TPA: hypothetical protein VHS78_19525 [Candidatus Elarobacter sp.]|nr:hypothetical protein [Candidatus Elarobacter sp.]